MGLNLTKFTENVNNISSLPDTPTETANQLKEKFDKAGIDIKGFINETLIKEITTQFNQDVSVLNKCIADTKKEINETIIKEKRNTLETAFPVGAKYITQEDKNPFDILAFGTWKRIKGKVLLGIDEEDEELNKIGKVGGVKEIELRAIAGAYDDDIYKFAYKKTGAINQIEHNMCRISGNGECVLGRHREDESQYTCR